MPPRTAARVLLSEVGRDGSREAPCPLVEAEEEEDSTAQPRGSAGRFSIFPQTREGRTERYEAQRRIVVAVAPGAPSADAFFFLILLPWTSSE